MKLIDHWKVVLKMSWAVKLAGAAGGLQAALVIAQTFDGVFISPWWSLCVAGLAFASGVARVVEQQRMALALDQAAVKDPDASA